jgi:hypothetical protein
VERGGGSGEQQNRQPKVFENSPTSTGRFFFLDRKSKFLRCTRWSGVDGSGAEWVDLTQSGVAGSGAE